MFSSRLRQGRTRNPLARALEERRERALPVIDLTLSNPTRAGFTVPATALTALAGNGSATYDPQPFGLLEARRAVSGEFGRRGLSVPPERVVLTSSTSEAYSFLFKLLCNSGDILFSPRPSYPLIEHLADLDEVRIEQYSLEFHGAWRIDVGGLRRRLEEVSRSTRVAAIILISPNNPTGSFLNESDLRAVVRLAREHDAALIADEVFADYALTSRAPVSALTQSEVLTFGMGGLSKTAGMPQMKLAWTGVTGPSALVEDALERLETICDTYLSVSTPVQLATPSLLEGGGLVRRQIQQRIVANLHTLEQQAAAHPACRVLPVEGGWSAVIQVPAIETEEKLVVRLLEETGVLVHPGYFFDFEREAFVVVSLLPAPADFDDGVARLFRGLESR